MSSSDVLTRLIELAATRYGKRVTTLAGSDDFFDALGIDSVEAMTMLTALEETFGVEIPDYEVQDVRTFAQLAEVIRSRL